MGTINSVLSNLSRLTLTVALALQLSGAQYETKTVISTEAAHGLIVSSAVAKPAVYPNAVAPVFRAQGND